jgi:iron-sulfur cluster repair protein YtfE (RIC family)
MPSNTLDMLLVHRVFRREFRDMPALITGVSAGDTVRATVVGNHLAFMVAALHHHQASADDITWPILRKRAPRRKADIDRMAAEHAEISEAVDRVQTTLAAWTTSAESSLGGRLLAASCALSTSVERRLDDGERNALPLIEEST